ncbi:short coiled-coil protein B isoform X2 [Folsomia candida]|nr:short coiled-coil protein B isoform X2 [Folsomia candida]
MINLEDDEEDNIPLADDDPQAILPEPDDSPSQSEQATSHGLTRSFDSFPSTFTNDSLSSAGMDPDLSQDEQEEKASRIAQVLELQNTLDDLSQRVENVKEENLKLRSENQVLGQYIESLMSASSVFQPTSPKTKRK